MAEVEWWLPRLTGRESENILRVLDSNYLNDGPLVSQVEETVRGFLGVRHAIAAPSGTAALTLGLMSAGVGANSVVAVSAHTYIATMHSAQILGARIKLVDVDSDTGFINLDELSRLVAEVDVLVVTHVSGRDCLSIDIMNLCERHGVTVVEDSAEALGSCSAEGRSLGTLGLFGVFSFSPNKIVTSGQGGLLVTNSDQVSQLARAIKNQGRRSSGTGGDDTHHERGYNFKWTDIQAAVLLPQLEELDARLGHLRTMWTAYQESFSNFYGFKIVDAGVSASTVPLWPEFRHSNRSVAISTLSQCGIPYRNMWQSISQQPSTYSWSGKFPGAEAVARTGLWLSSSLHLSPEAVPMLAERFSQAIDSDPGEERGGI